MVQLIFPNSLYLLNFCESRNESFDENFVFNVKCNSGVLWHYRLGHMSIKRMHILQKIYPDIHVPTDIVSDICHKSKQQKLSFPVSVSSSIDLFDLVHIDIWGPTVTAMNGSKYFLTIVDDYTRFTLAITMKSKAEVAGIVENFYQMVKNLFGKSIKVIRSDNGPEFNFFSLYAKYGILHQKSCVETPQ